MGGNGLLKYQGVGPALGWVRAQGLFSCTGCVASVANVRAWQRPSELSAFLLQVQG
jgi:hypothetical protein